MYNFVIGYGKGEIEPGIAPLVTAVREAGFITFSSCEGHPNAGECVPRFPSVGFCASEADALPVHLALRQYSDRLLCSWVLGCCFVGHRTTNEWVLGWTIENCGIIESVEEDEFEARTVSVGRERDIPVLVKMFGEIKTGRKLVSGH